MSRAQEAEVASLACANCLRNKRAATRRSFIAQKQREPLEGLVCVYSTNRLSGWVCMRQGRMHKLLARLGDPHNALPVVHVAGSKGKGSVTAMLAAVLQAARYRVGTYTRHALPAFAW